MKKTLFLSIGLAAFLAPAFGATLFSDNFDSSVTGLNVAPNGWTTTFGTVDTFQHGNFGLPCVGGGTSRCVDLDGTTSDAAVLTYNTTFNLTAFTQYVLTYNLAGNLRTSVPDSVTVCLGGTCEVRVIQQTDP